MICGIDNGVSGALTILSDNGALVAWTAMPIQRGRKGNEVDVAAVRDWLRTATGDRVRACEFVLEEPGGSKSARAACSMAGSFHALRALLTLMVVRWYRITPQQWQRAVLPGAKAGETKQRALEAARRLWPEETWLESARCRVAHDGAIDAALMADWARRTNL